MPASMMKAAGLFVLLGLGAVSAHSNSTAIHNNGTTSVVHTTKTYVVTSCAPTVTHCHVGSVTTETSVLYTTVCPYSSETTKEAAWTPAFAAPSLIETVFGPVAGGGGGAGPATQTVDAWHGNNGEGFVTLSTSAFIETATTPGVAASTSPIVQETPGGEVAPSSPAGGNGTAIITSATATPIGPTTTPSAPIEANSGAMVGAQWVGSVLSLALAGVLLI